MAGNALAAGIWRLTSRTDFVSMTDGGTRTLPRVEGVHLRNYRVLRDFQLRDMTPLTVLIGPNGSGKSTLFDVFAFLSECFTSGLPQAWTRRGGMRELRSRGMDGPLTIEVKYRERPDTPRITYHLQIDEIDRAPVVEREWLAWRRRPRGQAFRFLDFRRGSGSVAVGDAPGEDAERIEQSLTSSDLLAVSSLGQFKDHPRVAALREFITGWYLSCLTTPDLRQIRDAGPERRLSTTGENLANVLQRLQSSHPDRLADLFSKLASRVPELHSVTAEEQRDGSLVLRLRDSSFSEPIPARFVSDGTMKLLAHMVVLADPEPPPFIGIQEPENSVHLRLLGELAEECLTASVRAQLLVTTHAPHFLDALHPRQVRVLDRLRDGFARSRTAGDIAGVTGFIAGGGMLGEAWQLRLLYPAQTVFQP